MSATEDMLANMLRKALPAEVMEMLSPDNIAAFGEKINFYITDTQERLKRIVRTPKTILKTESSR